MKLKSRSGKALVSTLSELLFELVAVICGFILPRLILSHFGSAYNGITLSISQFIGTIALLKAGIGSVTRAALYKPLARNNPEEISEVVNATKKFMRKIAMFFSVAVMIFAAVYPLLVSNDFDWFFAFSLFLILSVDTFAQYFFGLPYQMVLQADQRTYIISIVNIISVVANTIVASILILSGFGIHIVKLGSAIVFLFPPIFYMLWVKKQYHLDDTVAPNDKLIAQRWDAFAHQLANFINTNTDIIIVTIILNLKEVSVYSVYYLVGNAIKKIVNAVGTGTMAAFGNMLAKGEEKLLRKRFSEFECLFFYVSTILLTITAILLTSFVSVYTKGITDVNYNRESFAILVSLSVLLMCIKVPYEQIVFAAGHFKQTRNAAFIEAGIHITLSIILTYLLGLNGIVLGVIIATTYRLVVYSGYVYKIILKLSYRVLLTRVLFSIFLFGGGIVVFHYLTIGFASSYISWIVQAMWVSVIIMLVGTVAAFLFFRDEMKAISELLLSKFKIKAEI